MSDDFPEPVKRILAARAGHLCSNPECRVFTNGPQEDPAKAVNVAWPHTLPQPQLEDRALIPDFPLSSGVRLRTEFGCARTALSS
jgi:hypothetical protein